jgi:hypothetical protein
MHDEDARIVQRPENVFPTSPDCLDSRASKALSKGARRSFRRKPSAQEPCPDDTLARNQTIKETRNQFDFRQFRHRDAL